jgi:CBS domain-containing protein
MLEDSTLKASDVMTRDVIVVPPYASLRYVAKLLAQHHISGLPVVDDANGVVGLVTETDLLRWRDDMPEKQAWWLDMLAEGFELSPDFLDTVRSEREKVDNFMSSPAISVDAETPLSQVAKRMMEAKVKRLPVLQDGRLVGIISRSDLIRAMAEVA